MANRNKSAFVGAMFFLLLSLITSNAAYDAFKRGDIITLVVMLGLTIAFILGFEEYIRKLNK